MQAPQDYLNTVATEESRKHKLFELEKRLHNQELYSANTVQIDLNRLIDGWNAMEERLDAMEGRLDALESASLEAPSARGGNRGKKSRKLRRRKSTHKHKRNGKKRRKKRRRKKRTKRRRRR